MLTDADFKVVYASGETEPAEFFIDALMESNAFDLGLGFFSTSGFRALSFGFAYFIHRNGRMRIIFNDVLTPEDKEAIENGIKSRQDELIEENIIEDILKLYDTLSSHDRHFFNCISWLIATKKIEIIAVAPVKSKPGIAHQKFGIFKDTQGNSVAFSGSINFSATALFKNLEAISCYKSWTRDNSDMERINYYESLFNKIWSGRYDSVRIVPIEQVKVIIRDKFPVRDIEDLLNEELTLLDELTNNYVIPTSFSTKLNHLKRKVSRDKPIQPSFPSENQKRPYQEIAVENWVKNDYKGLFEMATGTGKTITGLFASVELLKRLNSIVLLILVPTISLAEQWNEEVKKFSYQETIIVSSANPNWTFELQAGLNSFKLGTIKHLVVISTYDSYKSNKFHKFYDKFPPEAMLLADEAHSMGAPEMLKKMPFNIQYRLALSATPHRHFDDSGTQKLLEFFNASVKSTFVFGMKEAIANQFLCQYKLYPHFAELNEEEYQRYINLTKQIARRAHIVKNRFIETDVMLERMLQDRRKILNKAASKKNIVGHIIEAMKKNGKVHHTLVYCPEGNDEEEDNRIIDEFGKYLAFEKGLRIAQFTSATPAERRSQLLKEFDEGKVQCLLAMKCLDEGVDVKQTETAIFVSSSTNPRQYVQRRGRILRVHPNKPFAYLHDIIAVPPKIEMGDSKAKDVDNIILMQEFRRYREFAEDALNYVEAITPVKGICEGYKIEF
jgi:superfamily II DNA or RNA helicase